MPYKLAKQLKDAGFPQAADEKGTLRKGGSYLFPEGTNLAMSQKKLTERMAYAPSLEELIEACGFGRFFKIEKTHGLPRWEAEAWKKPNAPDDADVYVGSGPNPTEAVARLWLVLNKK